MYLLILNFFKDEIYVSGRMINKMMTSQTLQTKHLPTILLYTIQMRGSVNQLLSLDGYNEHVPIIISILITTMK